MNQTDVHLMIPDLLPHFREHADTYLSSLSLKALPQLLSHARLQSHGMSEGYLKETLQRFNLSVGNEVPAGALSALGLDITGTHPWWLCASPVLLQPNQNSVILRGNMSLQLRSVEVNQLLGDLSEVFAEHHMRLVAPKPLEWLVNLPAESQLITTPLLEALLKDISGVMPQGEEKYMWQRLSNDVQMMLHASKVNAERASLGKDPVNGLWFWGAGALPKAVEPVYQGCWTSSSIIKGACTLTETRYHALPTSIFGCVPHFKAGGKYLIVIEDLATLLAHGMGMQWAEALQEIEAVWFAPLRIFLKNGEIDNVFIHTGDGRQFHISRHTLRQWWRRTKSIEAFI